VQRLRKEVFPGEGIPFPLPLAGEGQASVASQGEGLSGAALQALTLAAFGVFPSTACG